jgi:hypothetical protein
MRAMKRAFIAYLVLLHLALASALWKRYTAESPFIPAMRQVHQDMESNVPAGAAIFLGDSITQRLVTSNVAPLSVNYGIGWQRSDQLIESMKGYESIQRASAVYIAIGVNDLLQKRQDGIDGRYRTILQAIPARIPVVLSSVSPLPTLDSDVVKGVRDAGARACAERPGCVFVDLLALLPAAGLQPDKVHLSAQGYRLWIGALRQALITGSRTSPSSPPPGS